MAKPVPGPIYEALYNLLGGNDGLPVQAAQCAAIQSSLETAKTMAAS